MATDHHDDIVKSNVERMAGFAALRKISQLSNEVNENDSLDKSWTKKAMLWLSGIGGIVVLVAVAAPSLIADTFRLISGALK